MTTTEIAPKRTNKPARAFDARRIRPIASRGGARKRVLIVDLNNFASYPTMAIGLVVAGLRNAGHDVEVICPLAYGAPAAFREGRESWSDYLKWRVHLSTSPAFRAARDRARDARQWWLNRPNQRTLREIEASVAAGKDIVLLSAYLQNLSVVRLIGRIAARHGAPLLIGGPMFNLPEVAAAWRDIPALVGIVGAETDRDIAAIVECAAEGGDLLQFDGVTTPAGETSRPAAPFRGLGDIPTPDYTDFPWDRYPFRVVPMMTGRGCQWSKCMFCSDVVTANGRTYRTRPPEAVLLEMQEQSRRHQAKSFIFTDIKLNSNPNMLRAISADLQSYVPGAEWVGTVHVDRREDNGLSRHELRAAVTAGMRRISFGFESASQRLLDAMDKGCDVEKNSAFIRHAHEAGLSVRLSMFKGYPGETADDLVETAAFLEAHAPYIDRIRIGDFKLIHGTPIYEAMASARGERWPIRPVEFRDRQAFVRYKNSETGGLAYRRAKARLIRAVFEINRREIRKSARAFDGLM